MASLAVAVAGHILLWPAPRPAALLVFAAPIGSLVGAMVCCNRVQGKGILVGLTSIGICVYAGLLSLFLCTTAFLVP